MKAVRNRQTSKREEAKKPIFIHISKTAGKSIKSYFGDRIQYRGARSIDYTEKEWNLSRYKFTCVRHPLERWVSCYFFMHRVLNSHPGKDKCQRKLWQCVKSHGPTTTGINEFTKFYLTGKHRFTGMTFNHKKPDRNNPDEELFFPQYDWSFHPERPFDHVCKMEGLMKDMRFLTDILVAKDIPKFPHHNKTNHQRWEDVLTDKNIEILHTYYRSDFRQFGYKLK